MQLNITNGSDTGKTVELPAKTAQQVKTQNSIQVKTIETQATRSMASLITASGLPQDKLSASILSFARFFSLALKPEQLAAIRRQAFVQQQTSSQTAQPAAQTAQQAANNAAAVKLPADISAEKARQVFSLAAAAAESKGVELQPKGLESLAQAIDPDSHKRQDGEDRGKKQKNKNQNEQEEKDSINAVNIKKLALETADNNPVLAILNKLPSKEGQRWIVLPFQFSQDGREFRVSMRVLMERDSAVFMAMDINEQLTMNSEQLNVGAACSRLQSFAFEFLNNKINKIIYYNQSIIENDPNKKIKNKLSQIFEIDIENIFIKTNENLPEADYGEKQLIFVDEAV